MTGLELWLANKGFDISANILIQELTKLNPVDQIKKYIQLTDNKINSIIEGYYRKALIYLRRNDLVKCEESLITYYSNKTITNLLIDFQAKKLLINFAILNEDYELAVEVLDDIILKYGFHEEIIPKILMDEYRDSNLKNKELIINDNIISNYYDGKTLIIDEGLETPFDSIPWQFLFSEKALVIQWSYDDKGWFSSNKYNHHEIISYIPWGTSLTPLFEISSQKSKKHLHAEILTGHFLVAEIFGTNYYDVYQVSNGRHFAKINSETFETCFRRGTFIHRCFNDTCSYNKENRSNEGLGRLKFSSKECVKCGRHHVRIN